MYQPSNYSTDFQKYFLFSVTLTYATLLRDTYLRKMCMIEDLGLNIDAFLSCAILWLFYLLTSNVKYIIIACLLNVLHYLLLMHCFLIISNVYKNNTNWFIYFDNVKKSYTSVLIPSILLCLFVYVALYNVNASKRGTNKNKKKAFLYLKCI